VGSPSKTACVIAHILCTAPGRPVPFSFSPTGNGAPGGARELARPPHGPPLRSGSPHAVRGRGDKSRPGRATPLRSGVLRLPALHSSSPRGLRRLDAMRGMSPRAPLRHQSSSARDERGLKAYAGYIFLDRIVVKHLSRSCDACAPRSDRTRERRLKPTCGGPALPFASPRSAA